MTTEAILILFVSVVIVVGVYFGSGGPIEAFKDAGPQLAAKIERSISTGNQFYFDKGGEARNPGWQ